MSFFSWLWVSGMTMTVLNPIAAPISARPIPVLPAVPSTMVPPRAQRALGHRIADDPQLRTVLDRLAGIHELRLAEDLATGDLRGSIQPDQRCVTGGF